MFLMVSFSSRRSASFTAATGDCRLFDQDRHSMAGQPVFGPSAEDGVDFLEVGIHSDSPIVIILIITNSLISISYLIQHLSWRFDE